MAQEPQCGHLFDSPNFQAISFLFSTYWRQHNVTSSSASWAKICGHFTLPSWVTKQSNIRCAISKAEQTLVLSDFILKQAYFLAIAKNSRKNNNKFKTKTQFFSYFGRVVISFDKNLYASYKKNLKGRTQGENPQIIGTFMLTKTTLFLFFFRRGKILSRLEFFNEIGIVYFCFGNTSINWDKSRVFDVKTFVCENICYQTFMQKRQTIKL